MSTTDWQEITHELFTELFRQSAVKRTGYAGLTRTIQFVTEPQTDFLYKEKAP